MKRNLGLWRHLWHTGWALSSRKHLFCFSYHETSGDIWLEDFVKWALGEGTAVEGEDFRHVTQTVFIVSAAMYCHRSMRVVGAGFVLYCTWRVEYTAELHRPAVVCRIAGVSDRLRVTLRLRKRKHWVQWSYIHYTGDFIGEVDLKNTSV